MSKKKTKFLQLSLATTRLSRAAKRMNHLDQTLAPLKRTSWLSRAARMREPLNQTFRLLQFLKTTSWPSKKVKSRKLPNQTSRLFQLLKTTRQLGQMVERTKPQSLSRSSSKLNSRKTTSLPIWPLQQNRFLTLIR